MKKIIVTNTEKTIKEIFSKEEREAICSALLLSQETISEKLAILNKKSGGKKPLDYETAEKLRMTSGTLKYLKGYFEEREAE